MRIVVLGSGGVGGYYGGLLAHAGEDVTFVARGTHLDVLRTRGLTIKTPERELTQTVSAVADSTRLLDVDLVLFCVKTYDTLAAAQSLSRVVSQGTSVLTLQNGVDNAQTIGVVVGHDAMLVGSVAVTVELAGPGVIVRSIGGEGIIVFGEPAGRVSDRVRRIASVFERANIAHRVSTQIGQVIWDKFLFIAGIGTVTALTHSGIGALINDPEGRLLLTNSCDEIVAVGKAENQNFGPEAVQRVVNRAAALPPHWQSSMARDLAVGRRLEVDALSGAVVRRGRSHGLPTPVHQAIWAALSAQQPPVTKGPDTTFVNPPNNIASESLPTIPSG